MPVTTITKDQVVVLYLKLVWGGVTAQLFGNSLSIHGRTGHGHGHGYLITLRGRLSRVRRLRLAGMQASQFTFPSLI